MIFTRHLHWGIYLLFLLSACAQQSAPTGGPKDTIPPRLVKVTPPHETTRFDAEKIVLEFTEDIILNAPKEQLIVTPNINKDYKITYRRNTVTLELAEPLEDSTTYTFNFRDAVGDITEKNPANNLLVAYSTGTYIDSLRISGSVHNILKGTIPKEATVALHPKNDTFNIFLHPAPYFTKTNTRGEFTISHLKPGQYFVYAIDDKNRNLIVNSRTEAFGFLGEEIELTQDADSVVLGLQHIDAGPLRMISARPYNTYFNIRTSKNLQSFLLTAPDSTEIVSTFGEDHANIRIYDTFTADSLLVHLLAIDSLDNAIDTTLYAKFLTREVTPEPFTVSITNTSLLPHRGQLTARMQFSKPIAHIQFDSLYFQVDSLTRLTFNPSDLQWDPHRRRLTLTASIDPDLFPTPPTMAAPRTSMPEEDAPSRPKPINALTLGEGAFLSVETDTSQQVRQTVKPVHENELSVINITIQTSAPHFFVQLLNNQYEAIREVKDISRIRFVDVPPGDYKVRLIIDHNNNGRWDPGNYSTRTEPEPVVYYTAPDGSHTIKGVKANWEIGTDGEMLITW